MKLNTAMALPDKMHVRLFKRRKKPPASFVADLIHRPPTNPPQINAALQ
jgi:hypothetical protein